MDKAKCESLWKAKHLNPGVQVAMKEQKAAIAVAGGRPLGISNSLVTVKLYWGLTGCRPGKQHFRYCTPHALRKPMSLRCRFCSYDEVEWAAAKAQFIPVSEQLLMKMLAGVGLDQQVCCQVRFDWWPAPADFMLMRKPPVIIQADGSSHTKEMHGHKQLDSDLRFCMQAYAHGVSVIRVHEHDTQCRVPALFLTAAVVAASNQVCIVLSPNYRTVYAVDNGILLDYAHMLACRLPGATISGGNYSNTIMFRP